MTINTHPEYIHRAGEVRVPHADVFYDTHEEVKDARERLLFLQRDPKSRVDIDTGNRERTMECMQLLHKFGKHSFSSSPKFTARDLQALTDDSFCLPLPVARAVLSGSETVWPSCPEAAPLMQQLRSLKHALFLKAGWHPRTTLGNRYTGLIKRVVVWLPETPAGPLHGIVLRDRRGDDGFTVQPDSDAVVLVVPDVKQGSSLPLVDAIAAGNEWTERWVEDFGLLKGSGWGADGASGQELQGRQPFTFPILQIMVVADKAFVSDVDVCLKGRDRHEVERRVTQLSEQVKESLETRYQEVKEALYEAARGRLTDAEAAEVVHRQVAITPHWRRLRSDLKKLGLAEERVEALLGPPTEVVFQGLGQKRGEGDRAVVARACEVAGAMKGVVAAASLCVQPRHAIQALPRRVFRGWVLQKQSFMGEFGAHPNELA
jgi:hypothetical protein